MQITYTKYPLLLFLSYNKDNAPQDLPFEVEDHAAATFQQQSKELQSLLAYFPLMNSLQPSSQSRNYYLTDKLLALVDRGTHFRNEHFKNFFHIYVKPERGIALMQEGGQYIYALFGKHDTLKLKHKKGRYIAVALFHENLFLGFEEGIITEQGGVDIMETGYYGASRMDIGGYISFVLVFLGYLTTKNNLRLMEADQNLTSEEVLYVD